MICTVTILRLFLLGSQAYMISKHALSSGYFGQ